MAAKKITSNWLDQYGLKAKLVQPKRNFLMMIEPSNPDSTLNFDWVARHRDEFESLLFEHGVIFLKNFNMNRQQFKEISDTLYPGETVQYSGGTSPRSKNAGIYESTVFPRKAAIGQHSEMAYFRTFPSRILFFCEIAAQVRGETPVCCNRNVTNLIDKKIVERFSQREVMYIRNFYSSDGANLWQKSFETDSKETVENVCRSKNISVEWIADDWLRTRNVSQGTIIHPVLKSKIWFNSAYALNFLADDPVNLPPAARLFIPALSKQEQEKLFSRGHETLGYNTYYGDNGKPIELSILDELHQIYTDEQVAVPWHRGDLMIIDNTLASHGRNDFEGDRLILVDIKN